MAGLTQTSLEDAQALSKDLLAQHLALGSGYSSDVDALLDEAIASASDQFEQLTGRQLLTADYTWNLDGFPSASQCIDPLGNLCDSNCGLRVDSSSALLRVPRPPLVSVASVAYLDEDGDSQTLVADEDYYVDTVNTPGIIQPLDSWPSTSTRRNCVTVTFSCGYGSENVPASERRALLLMASHYFTQRTIVADVAQILVPAGAQQILDNLKVEW